MTQFEIVRELLHRLRKDEVRSLRRFLQLFEEESDTNQLKSMALMELLLNKKNYPEEKVCKKLYGDHGSATLKTFNKMLLRFKDKIGELLILDINIYRKEAHDDLTMAVSQVRKLLLQVNVLEGKAPVQEVIKMYDKIRMVARKYELYDELLLALTGKINYVSKWTDEGTDFGSQAEILFYDRCRHSLLRARDTYSKLVRQRIDRHQVPDEATYNKAIEELEHEYRYTKSASIGHLLYSLMCDYQQAIHHFDDAERACQRLISLISEHPAVYQNDRMTRVFLDLANIELCRCRIRQAEAALQRARVYGKGNPSLETSDFEITFHAMVYKGEFAQAETWIEEQAASIKKVSPLWASRFNYYLAAVKTVLGKTHEALPLLQETAELEKDSLQWNSGIRLLVILNLLQAEKLDAAESHIENFRKYLERSAKNGFVPDRIRLTVKLLGRLANESFDFRLLSIHEKNNLELLESQVPNLAWQPRSPELIVFPIWIRSRIKQNEYSRLFLEWFNGNRPAPMPLSLFN